MNQLFDPNTPMGNAFNDIFGQAPNAKLEPSTTDANKSLPPAARIGAARPTDKPTDTR